MKELAEANVYEEIIMNGYDSLAELLLFMVATMGNYHDWSGIYGIMRMSLKTNNRVFDGCTHQQKKRRRI